VPNREKDQIQTQGSSQDAVRQRKLILDLHRISEPAKYNLIQPSLVVSRAIIIDANLMMVILVELG